MKARLAARAMVSYLLCRYLGEEMGQGDDIKIRVLPRKTEPRREDGSRGPKRGPSFKFKLPEINRSYVFATLAFVVAALSIGLALREQPESKELPSTKPVRDTRADKISKFVEDVKLKEEIQRQRRVVENLRSSGDLSPETGAASTPEMSRSYGVQLDTENTADRLYEALNDHPQLTTTNTPDDRINAMLEKNKWLNQQERQERIQYVRNFIKTAYDRGYEVDLDKNLQVVGVRPIANRRVTLEEIINKINAPPNY